MTAKEYLGELRKLNVIILQKIDTLNTLRSISTSLRSMDYSGLKVETGGQRNASFVKPVLKITDLEAELNIILEEFAFKKNEIIDQIHGLEDEKYIRLLYKRFIEFKNLAEIADEMGYAYVHIKRLNAKALKAFESCYQMILNDTK